MSENHLAAFDAAHAAWENALALLSDRLNQFLKTRTTATINTGLVPTEMALDQALSKLRGAANRLRACGLDVPENFPWLTIGRPMPGLCVESMANAEWTLKKLSEVTDLDADFWQREIIEPTVKHAAEIRQWFLSNKTTARCSAAVPNTPVNLDAISLRLVLVKLNELQRCISVYQSKAAQLQFRIANHDGRIAMESCWTYVAFALLAVEAALADLGITPDATMGGDRRRFETLTTLRAILLAERANDPTGWGVGFSDGVGGRWRMREGFQNTIFGLAIKAGETDLGPLLGSVTSICAEMKELVASEPAATKKCECGGRMVRQESGRLLCQDCQRFDPPVTSDPDFRPPDYHLFGHLRSHLPGNPAYWGHLADKLDDANRKALDRIRHYAPGAFGKDIFDAKSPDELEANLERLGRFLRVEGEADCEYVMPLLQVAELLEAEAERLKNLRTRPNDQLNGRGETVDEATVSNAAIADLTPAVRKAYFAFNHAERKAEKCLEDQEAYNLLKEVDFDADKGDLGELAGYKLPGKPTFARYLGKARQVLKEQKYSRRNGRQTGSSVVRQDQIEQPETED